MTIKVNVEGASVTKPGVYPILKVLNLSGFPLVATGTVAIVGEAVGGEPGTLIQLEGAQIQAAKATFKSGPIADALAILSDPSADERIKGGASKVIVFKTNAGTKSASLINNQAGSPSAKFTLASRNWGADECLLSKKLTAGTIADAAASLTGTIGGPFAMTTGLTLKLVIAGVTYTYTTALNASTAAADVVTDLNTEGKWSPSKPIVASVVDTNKVKIALLSTVALLEYGTMYVDPTSTADTVLGITDVARGVAGSRFINFVKSSVSETAISEIGEESFISVKYVGSAVTCKLSIKDVGSNRLLTTTCAAVAADDLSMVLGTIESGTMVQKMTMQDVINTFSASVKYEVSALSTNVSKSALNLDFYDNLDIELVAASLKCDAYDLVNTVSIESALVTATRVSNIYGSMAIDSGYTFFTGGTNGVSSNTTFGDGFEAFGTVRANHVVPLISADSGSVTIASVNALAASHAAAMWAPEHRSPRRVWMSLLGTKAELKAAAKVANTGYCNMVGQDVSVFSESQQALAWLDPWAYACICAGMAAAAPVGEPITYKFIKANDLRVRDGSWNPKIDAVELIAAGVPGAEPVDAGGFRNVLGTTTYSKDASFVWNRASVTDVGGFLYYDLMVNLEAEFTGVRAKTGSAVAIANFVKARMEMYLTNGVIVGDDNNKGLGYVKETLRVVLNGAVASIDVTVTPAQGIDFILPRIYLADIKQSA